MVFFPYGWNTYKCLGILSSLAEDNKDSLHSWYLYLMWVVLPLRERLSEKEHSECEEWREYGNATKG